MGMIPYCHFTVYAAEATFTQFVFNYSQVFLFFFFFCTKEWEVEAANVY